MKITVLDGGVVNPGDIAWTPVTEIAETEIHAETAEEEIAARTADADVVVINRLPLGPEQVARLGPKVRLVSIMSSACDTVSLPALEKRGIAVCNIVEYNSEDTAQHTMGMLLELVRHIGEHSASVHDGEWSRRSTWCYWLESPQCLDKKILGLIGFGSVGRRVGHLANAFGMEVLAFNPSPRNPPSYGAFSFVSLETLLARSDVVSLHCPLTPQTREIICAKTLARMKDGAFLLNTAHGGLVNEEDCLEALRTGKLAGMGTDVLRAEPPEPDDPLLTAPNVLITPHMAGASRKSRQRVIALTGENIRRWLQGTPVNLLTKAKKSNQRAG